jgi:hypothetical protein
VADGSFSKLGCEWEAQSHDLIAFDIRERRMRSAGEKLLATVDVVGGAGEGGVGH